MAVHGAFRSSCGGDDTVQGWLLKVLLEEQGDRTQKDFLSTELSVHIRCYVLNAASVPHWKASADLLGYSRLPGFTSLRIPYLYLF